MSHRFTTNPVHVVFSTKERAKLPDRLLPERFSHRELEYAPIGASPFHAIH